MTAQMQETIRKHGMIIESLNSQREQQAREIAALQSELQSRRQADMNSAAWRQKLSDCVMNLNTSLRTEMEQLTALTSSYETADSLLPPTAASPSIYDSQPVYHPYNSPPPYAPMSLDELMGAPQPYTGFY